MTESNEHKPMTFTCQQLAACEGWCGPGKCPMWCGLGRCQPVFAARAAAPQAEQAGINPWTGRESEPEPAAGPQPAEPAAAPQAQPSDGWITSPDGLSRRLAAPNAAQGVPLTAGGKTVAVGAYADPGFIPQAQPAPADPRCDDCPARWPGSKWAARSPSAPAPQALAWATPDGMDVMTPDEKATMLESESAEDRDYAARHDVPLGHLARSPEPAPISDEHHGLDTDEHVRFYEHDFYPLSNFSAFNLRWQGVTFPTSEHAYHCQKFRDNERRFQIANAPSAHEAFKIAERHKGERRKDWDDVKVGIMREILLAKAVQHEYVRRKLLATGDRTLFEDSWRDDFWGWGPNRDGQNMLGKLWMEVRAEIRLAEKGKPHD